MQDDSSDQSAMDDWDTLYALLDGRIREEGDCWVWTGYRMPHGHGQIRRQSYAPRAVLVHRYVWSQLVGDLGDWYVLHHCDNPPCVRLSHLWLGTQTDNNRDMWQKGRGVKPPMNWDGIHCKHGHVIDDNPYIDPRTGTRRCKTCMNAKSRRWIKDKRGIGRGA